MNRQGLDEQVINEKYIHFLSLCIVRQNCSQANTFIFLLPVNRGRLQSGGASTRNSQKPLSIWV